MDGAEASYLYFAVNTIACFMFVLMSRRAWGSCGEASGVSLRGAAPSADLGGSSKYSNGNFED